MQRDDHDHEEAVRLLAYEISEGPDAGTPVENWLRAESDLERGREAADDDRDARDGEAAGNRVPILAHS